MNHSAEKQQGDYTQGEAQRLLKSNHNTLQQIQSEAANLKTNIEALVSTKVIDDRQNTAISSNLVEKITFAEDTFLNNISECFQTLVQTTSLLQNLPSNTSPPSFLPQTLSHLQGLHTQLNKTLEDFPNFEVEKSRKPTATDSQTQSPQPLGRSMFKDRLLRDQGDLTKKLRQSLLSIEKQSNSDTYSQLNAEIERSHELQAKLESKNHLIHRIGLLIGEGLDRTVQSLTQLLKLADSSEAHTFLSFMAREIDDLRTRFGSLTAPSIQESSKQLTELKEEYEQQKKGWSTSMSDLQQTLEDKSTALIREIEAERLAHEETMRRAKDLQERLRSQDDYEVRIKVLERDLVDRDTKLDKIDRELKTLEPLSTEVDQLKRENQSLKNKNIQKGEELSTREMRIQELRDELIALRRDVDELGRTKSENKSLSEYRSHAELTIRKNTESLDVMRGEYLHEIEQLREQIREHHLTIEKQRKELERKNNTVAELNQMVEQLREQLDGLGESIKTKEKTSMDGQSRVR